MISDEALEAAAKAFRETKFMDDALMNALEAAAPHMQQEPSAASVWDESNARAALDAALPHVLRDAVADELTELADLIEPVSGIGLANGATRGDVAQWIRKRAETYRRTK